MSGLFLLSTKGQPEGWFKALTISGKPAGLGFQCPVCHLGFRHSAPREFVHCGKLEKAPVLTALLPEQSLGDPILPPRIVPIGTW